MDNKSNKVLILVVDLDKVPSFFNSLIPEMKKGAPMEVFILARGNTQVREMLSFSADFV
jgi:hypothetical protein